VEPCQPRPAACFYGTGLDSRAKIPVVGACATTSMTILDQRHTLLVDNLSWQHGQEKDVAEGSVQQHSCSVAADTSV
jgi:hypothetical protein